MTATLIPNTLLPDDRPEIEERRREAGLVQAVTEADAYADPTKRVTFRSLDHEVLAELLVPAWVLDCEGAREAVERFAADLQAATDLLSI